MIFLFWLFPLEMTQSRYYTGEKYSTDICYILLICPESVKELSDKVKLMLHLYSCMYYSLDMDGLMISELAGQLCTDA